MSQRGRKKRGKLVQSDDSGDEDYSQSQSQSQQITSREVQALAGQVCNLLLVGEMKKIPVKSAAIKKFILKKYRSSFNSVMKKAGEIMEHVFGYEIVSLAGGSYILVNAMGDSMVKHQSLSDSEASVHGVLVSILIAIFMSEGKIAAGSLEAYLIALDVDITLPAEKTMIQDFVRKKYLETVVEQSSDPPNVLYSWGERAHAEVSKKDILDLVCKVYGNNMKPTMWTYQWNAVEEENKEKNAAVSRQP